MNLKTAERLLEYRKKAGFSQEELAEKIGVSRQAVSKWERAEASPDTDNLIALADVYGVTLDELIKGKSDDRNDTGDHNGVEYDVFDEKRGEKVHIGLKGIHVEADGNKVHIDKNGVFVKDNKGNTVVRDGHTLPDGHLFPGNGNHRSKAHYAFKHFPYPVLTAAAYLIFGYFGVCGGWTYGWMIFLTIPLYYSLVSAVFNRNASHFAYPVLVTVVYLYLGFFHSAWHPMWLLFLTIPFYYFFCEFVKKLVHKL